MQPAQQPLLADDLLEMSGESDTEANIIDIMSEESDTEANFIDVRGNTERAAQGMGKMSQYYKKVKHCFSFIGPAFMISIGYMDPGNWSTDLESGTRFKYKLLFVILFSNLIAILLQHLTIRIGIYTKKTLAQVCREQLDGKPHFWIPIYLLTELAIMATDMAELIGCAIALEILFGIPVIYGILITSVDVIFFFFGMEKLKSPVYLELLLLLFVAVISICFCIDLAIAKPSFVEILEGFNPIGVAVLISKNSKALRASLGIIGATVMPHNLYLHSSIVQHRANWDSSKKVVLFATYDTIIALSLAFLVNCSILIVAGSSLYKPDQPIDDEKVASLKDATGLLENVLGSLGSTVFAVALLLAGQSSTITGTIAGTVVFEGFLNWKVKPWIRRLVTRLLSLTPTIIIVLIAGDGSSDTLLLWSQIILSIQLPFAAIPLVYFTSKESIMGREGKCPMWMTICSWIISLTLVILNLALIFDSAL